MDRFIGVILSLYQFRDEDLKSNMDRFIVVSEVKKLNAKWKFKIQYG